MTWQQVADYLSTLAPGTAVRVERIDIDPPTAFRRSIGMPAGQLQDYRLTMSDCRGLHVKDFGDHYEAHIDQIDPACGLLAHLKADAPKLLLGVGIVAALLLL